MRRALVVMSLFACSAPAAAQEGAGDLVDPRAGTQHAAGASGQEASDGTPERAPGSDRVEEPQAPPERSPAGPQPSGRVGRAIGWVMVLAGATLAVAGPIAARRSMRNLVEEPRYAEYHSLVPPDVGDECVAARSGETFGTSEELVAHVVRSCDRIDTLGRIRWLLVGLGAVIGVFGLTLVVRRPGHRRTALMLEPHVGRAGGTLELVGFF